MLGLLAPASSLALTQTADFGGEARHYRSSAVHVTNALFGRTVKRGLSLFSA
jgi:hypothetical protein